LWSAKAKRETRGIEALNKSLVVKNGACGQFVEKLISLIRDLVCPLFIFPASCRSSSSSSSALLALSLTLFIVQQEKSQIKGAHCFACVARERASELKRKTFSHLTFLLSKAK
jgi:hypothetical protein